jgi:hypothetical protein
LVTFITVKIFINNVIVKFIVLVIGIPVSFYK